MNLKVKRLSSRAILPRRANSGDLGFDLFSLETVGIQPGETVVVSTGIACEFPENWGAFIKARSSQGKVGIDIYGGVVDCGYRGEISVCVHNSNDPHGSDPIIYHAGEKIGQLIMVPLFPGDVEEVTKLGSSERGEKGFGSSGR